MQGFVDTDGGFSGNKRQKIISELLFGLLCGDPTTDVFEWLEDKIGWGSSFSSDEQRKMFYQKTQFYLDNIMKDCHGNYLIYYIFITFERTVFSEISEIVSKIEENVVTEFA